MNALLFRSGRSCSVRTAVFLVFGPWQRVERPAAIPTRGSARLQRPKQDLNRFFLDLETNPSATRVRVLFTALRGPKPQERLRWLPTRFVFVAER